MQKLTASIRVGGHEFRLARYSDEIMDSVADRLGRELGRALSQQLRVYIKENSVPNGMRFEVTDRPYEFVREYSVTCGVITEHEYDHLKALQKKNELLLMELYDQNKELVELQEIKKKYERLQKALKEVTG